MSNENESDTPGIADLRKQFDALQKQNSELQTQLGGYVQRDRQASVAEILKAKDVNPAAAKFYTGEDTSEDAVGKWLSENAEVFGAPKQQVDANAEAAKRAAEASFGTPGSIQAPTSGPILGDPEEIMHALQTLPYEQLQELGYMPKGKSLFNPRG